MITSYICKNYIHVLHILIWQTYDNAQIHSFGGINASHLYNDIWYFDLVTRIWHQIAAVGYIPAPRESCAAALVDDTIYIFGGKGLNGVGLGDLCAYRIKSQRWYMFQNMGAPPSPRFGSTLTVIQSKIYVFGGESVSGKTEDSSHVYILDCCKVFYFLNLNVLDQHIFTFLFLLCSQNKISS
jgi:N-acetylneuraminic acid mutarotase